mgnify:CR=1 FL=1
MEAAKREFIINDLMVENFIEYETDMIYLEETEDTGRSHLDFKVISDRNLVIKNVDKQNTDLLFFRNEKKFSMFKRVDHIIFENLSGNDWKLHLIEMKSNVLVKRWSEIKGKFRASYLLAQGLAAMLEMNLVEICMYTTYEKVNLVPPATMPTGRRLPLGETYIKPKDEWDSGEVILNFNRKISFSHNPIQMQRNEEGILTGEWICSS